jgi:hypothetical protein
MERSGLPSSPVWLRDQAQRAFTHGEMRSACEVFSRSSKTYSHLLVPPFASELQSVAAAFVELQQLRHAADYDLSQTFDRTNVLEAIELARTAMTDWNKVRNTPNSNVFLAALLLHNRWNR